MNKLYAGFAAAMFALCLAACSDADSTTSVPNDVPTNPSSSSGAFVDSVSVEKGSMIDPRDGQVYKTVTIGSQTWMAENLNYDPGDVSDMGSYAWSGCYDDDPANCQKYGRLYTWEVALDNADCAYGQECYPDENVQGVCPTGWHLPSDEEWRILFKNVGGIIAAGTKLKFTSGWNGDGNGSDSFGFAVLPAGYRNFNGYFCNEGNYAYFWSSTERFYVSDAGDWRFCYNDGGVYLDLDDRYCGASVRCLQDSNEGGVASSSSSQAKPSSSSSVVKDGSEYDPSTKTLTDPRDGQVYKTVTIGNQTWMAENLNYPTDNSYCYDHDPVNCQKYGSLYTWRAAMNACPSGWHLPSGEEFETLLSYVGSDDEERSNNLRSSGWGNGADRYGFSALPAGAYYYSDEEFFGLGYITDFWSSTEFNSDYAYRLGVDDYNAYVSYSVKYFGFPVRCLQDSNEGSEASSSSSQAKPSSSSSVVKDGSEYDPSTKTLTDHRDNQVYKTVTIGTQTWMAENLNYPTDNSYCYDNDPVNCQEYGRLYTWSAAMGVCPTGWHLPSKEEFGTLLSNVLSAVMLRSSGWGDGADRYGFSALPAGYYNSLDKKFVNLGHGTSFWSSTEYSSSYAYSLSIDGSAYVGNYGKRYGHSVRCLQDYSNEGGVASSSSSQAKPSSSSSLVIRSSSSSAKSSSSFARSSSSSVRSGSEYSILWDGSDTEGRVNTGSKEETAGYWFYYNDNAAPENGDSKIIFPADVEENMYGNFFGPLAEAYGGIKASIEIGTAYDYAYAGFGFNIVSENQEGADITEWDGICLTYSSTAGFAVELVVEDDAIVTEHNNYKASVPKSSVATICLPWSKFRQESGWGVKADQATVLAHTAAIKLKFTASSDFFLYAIGCPGKCGENLSYNIRSSSSVARSSSSSVVLEPEYGHLAWWDGSDTEGKVVTGSEEETAGYWFYYDDNAAPNNGDSKIIFPPDVEENTYGNFFGPLCEAYGGIKASIKIGTAYEYAFAGFGFNIVSMYEEGADITEWGGICLTYSSTASFAVKLVEEDTGNVTSYNNYKATVPKSAHVTTACLPWSSFKQEAGWGEKVDQAEILSKVATIKLDFTTSGDFYLTSIGSRL